MRQLFTLLLAFAACTSFGQIIPDKILIISKPQKIDTSLRVIHVDRNKPETQPAIFVNGKYLMNLTGLNPQGIESMEVIKRDTIIDGIPYNGQIYIKTKSDYYLKLISLTQLKNKYTDFKEKPVLFMINGNIVSANYDNYLVDENNLLTITVDKIQVEKEKMDMGLIKLLTKSEENIRGRNTVLIRGKEMSMNK